MATSPEVHRQPTMIATANLLIRRYRRNDLDALLTILSDRETMRFWPEPYERDAAAAWIERSLASYAEHGFERYAVVLKRTDRIIGDCGILRAVVGGQEMNDLGYILHRTHWGRGLALEAATAVRDHAFRTLGLDALHANMPVDHHASRRIAEKLGMTRLRAFDNALNRNIRTYLYGLRRPA